MIYLMIKPLYYRCQIWKDDATALLAWDQTKVVAAAVWQKKRGRLGLLQIGYVTKHKKGGSKFIAINLGIGFSVLLIIKCGFFWENWLFLMDEAQKNVSCTRHILIRLITQKEFLMNYFKNTPCFKEEDFFCPALNEVIYYIMRLV